MTGDYVGKDEAVVREITAELGSGLGALEDVTTTIDVAKSV